MPWPPIYWRPSLHQRSPQGQTCNKVSSSSAPLFLLCFAYCSCLALLSVALLPLCFHVHKENAQLLSRVHTLGNHGGDHGAEPDGADPADAVPQGQCWPAGLGHPVRRPVGAGRGCGGGGRVPQRGLLQGDQPRRAGVRHRRAGGPRDGVLRAAHPGEAGHVRRRPALGLRQQEHRLQRRRRVAGVPPPLPQLQHRQDRLPAAPTPDCIGGLHGGGEGGGRARAGADSGGPGLGRPRPAAGDGGGAGRQRRAGAGEPLPALHAAGAGGLRRDGVRGAHGPADHLPAQVQLHRGPADQAPGRQVGPRAPRPGILLRQRRGLASGPDERPVPEREAPRGGAGGGAVAAVRDLLRRAGAGAADRAAAAGDAGRGAEPVQGVHVGRVQERRVQDPPRGPPARPLRAARQQAAAQRAARRDRERRRSAALPPPAAAAPVPVPPPACSSSSSRWLRCTSRAA